MALPSGPFRRISGKAGIIGNYPGCPVKRYVRLRQCHSVLTLFVSPVHVSPCLSPYFFVFSAAVFASLAVRSSSARAAAASATAALAAATRRVATCPAARLSLSARLAAALATAALAAALFAATV